MPRARVTYSSEYPIDPGYAGLLRALEANYEGRPRHRLDAVDFRPLDNQGYKVLASFAGGRLTSLSPAVDEGWVVVGESGGASILGRVSGVVTDMDQLTIRFDRPTAGVRWGRTLSLLAPDFQSRLREWLSRCPDRPLPALYSALCDHGTLDPPRKVAAGGLRARQAEAVGRMGQGVLVLWGPPGTGKTYTLARGVHELVQEGYRVVVLAPTNVATDNATLHVDEAFAKLGTPLRSGQLLRAGYPALEELEQREHLVAWQASLRESTRELERVRRRLNVLERKLKGLTRSRERVPLLSEQAELQDKKVRIERGRGEALWALASRCDILVTTVYLSLHRPEMAAVFSTDRLAILCDEAGMVPRFSLLPLLELASGGEVLEHRVDRPPSRVVLGLAGDHRQLGPIYHARNPGDVNARYWLGESLLDVIKLDDRADVEAQEKAGRLVVLNEQTRMDHTICARISRAYYFEQLSTLPDPQRPCPPVVGTWPDDGVFLVDAARVPLDDDAPAPRQLHKSKRFNERSLWAGLALIRRALESGARRVLWLTPFREQAEKARSLVSYHFSTLEEAVTAGTVHVSQGTEADLVIFDPVDPTHTWLKGQYGDPSDVHRLINVGISRARAQVVVLAPRNRLRRSLFWKLLHDAPEWNCPPAPKGSAAL